MTALIKKTCPNCKNETIVPWYVVMFAPLWPFSTWNCSSCHISITYKLLSYYLALLIGLGITVFVSALFSGAGFPRGSLVNALSMIVTAVFGLIWFPAKLGEVKNEKA